MAPPAKPALVPARWGLITLAVAVLFLADFAGLAAEWRNSRLPWPLRYPFVWGLTGHLAFLAVLPLLLAFFERHPLTRARWPAQLPRYAVVFLALTLLQTLLMWGSRILVYLALGWGRYEYGDPRYIVPMELMRALPGYLGALGFFSLFRVQAQRRERALHAARVERELAEARLRLLRAQLQPHFLFNALNLIRTYVHDDAAAADRMVGHLADLLRLSLRHATAPEVPLATELALLDAYLAIMRARFEDRLRVELRIAEDVGAALIPSLLLQPLVENAVHNALREPGVAACIEVTAARDGAMLRLRVADNGPGAAAAGGGHGVGLANTRDRLRFLYGDAQHLEVGDRPGGGYEARVALPYHTAPRRAATPEVD